VRVYFAPCGIALGHAGRCIPLAKRFVEKGHQVFFSTYGDAVPYVERAGFPVERVPPVQMREKIDGTFDFKRTLAAGPGNIYRFLLQVGAELNLIERFKAEVVISDSRLSTILAARMRSIPSVLLLHQLRLMIPHVKPIGRRIKQRIKSHIERVGLELFGSLWRLSTFVVVPDFPPPYTIAKANVVPSKQYTKKLRIVGPIIPKRPEQLPPRESLREQMGFNHKPVIYAAMSGTIPEKRYISMLLARIFSRFPKDYTIILSQGIPAIHNQPIKRGPLQIYSWVNDRYALLKSCDLLITRGGHNTVAEAMYYGIPMLVIPTPGHSEHQGIAKSVEQMGLGLVVQQHELSFSKLLDAVAAILGDSSFKKRAEMAARFAAQFDAISSIYRIALRAAGLEFSYYLEESPPRRTPPLRGSHKREFPASLI